MPNQMIALQARAPRIPTYNQLVAGRDANLARQNALAIQEQAMQQTAAAQAKAARNEAAMANALKLAQTGDIAGAEKQFGLGAGNLEVHKTLTGLQDEQLKQARARLVAAGAASLQIKQAPDEASRRALLTQLTPQLQAAGWTAEQIAGFPLDDKSLETAITNAISPDDTIKAHMETQKPRVIAPGAALVVGGKKIFEQPANVPQGTIQQIIGPDGQPQMVNIVNGVAYPITVGGQRPAGPGLVGGPRGGVAGALQTNPGALKDGAFAKSQPGYTGASGGFATFATPEAGIAAQEALLRGSYVNKGYNTIDKIVNRYAPPGPENSAASVSNYKKYIAGQTGIDINQPITAAQVPAVAKAMREFETGQRPGGAAPGQVARPVPKADTGKSASTESERRFGTVSKNMKDNINDLIGILSRDPSAVKPGMGEYVASGIPFIGEEARKWAQSAGRQQFEASILAVLDNITYINTGAGTSKEQEANYYKSYIPTIQDDDASAKKKLERMVRFAKNVKDAAGVMWTPEMDAQLAGLERAVAGLKFGGSKPAPAKAPAKAPANPPRTKSGATVSNW